jgi:hypothetical protein
MAPGTTSRPLESTTDTFGKKGRLWMMVHVVAGVV